jgi:heat shock protein HslJ
MFDRVNVLLAGLAVSVVCAACAGMSKSAAGTLAANDWHLVAINGMAAIPGDEARRPTIRFSTDSARASGSGGCNSYSGTATVSGESLHVSRVISTKRACIDQALNEQETRFFGALETVDRYGISGDTLSLYRGPDVALRFVR